MRSSRPKTPALLLVTAVCLTAGSCAADATLPPTRVNITTSGGIIAFLNGLVTLTVPPGAVPRDTFVTVESATGVPSSGLLVSGTSLEFKPDGMTFLVPISAKVKVGSIQLPTGVRLSELRIHKVIGGQWVLVSGGSTGADSSVSASLSGFSTYAVLGLPVASVVVSPATPTVAVGQQLVLGAVPRDAQSTPLPQRSVTWTTSNASVATVSNSGSVGGVSVGTATITATSEGITGTALVTVTAGAAPGIWLQEDFSTYSDIGNFLANPRGIYSSLSAASEGNEVFGRAQMTLENSGFGTSNKSLRYNYPDRTALTASRCQDYSIGVNLTLPNPTAELWIEVVAQYSSNFLTRAPVAWGCASNPDHKFIFGRVNSGRFNLDVGTGGAQWTWGYPGNEDNEFGWAASPFDGQWHTYRLHMKTSQSGTGAARFWFDGVLTKSFVNFTSTGQSIYGIAIGRNLNQGPGQAQSVTIGRVRIWNTDPGF